ncbi:uncharacterized protein LOC144754819 [Lissotriton helveticus]
MLYKNSLKAGTLLAESIEGAEVLGVKLHSPSRCIIAIVVYRPPKTPPKFVKWLVELAHDLCSHYQCLNILGDFNFHWEASPKESPATLLDEALTALRLSQSVTGPTHAKGHTLDLVWTSLPLTSPPIIHPCAWSDHSIIYGTFQPPKLGLQPPPRWRVIRSWNKISAVNLAPALRLSGPPDYSSGDINAKNYALTKRIIKAIDSLAPARRERIKDKGKGVPWYNDKLRTLKQQLRQGERAWRKAYDPPTLSHYLETFSAYKHAIQTEKAAYYENKIVSASNTQKETFKVLKELRQVKEQKPAFNKEDCEKFQTFFTSKMADLLITIENTPKLTCSLSPVPIGPSLELSLTSFPPLTHEALGPLFGCVKSGSPADPCPPRIYKLALPEIEGETLSLLNMSLETGVVPSAFKEARVIPLLKKPGADTKNLKIFRPISQLPFLAKVLEQHVLSSLAHHLEANDLLQFNQAGFRPHHSTELVMLAVLDDLRLRADSKDPCALILLDLSAAFDTVNHELLLSRMSDFGVQGIAMTWLTSFLKDRSQRVQLGEAVSRSGTLPCGVPQGSALSPLLFITYLQPLIAALNELECQIYNYADDTQIIIRIHNSLPAHQKVQNILKFTINWMSANYLKINPDKTEVLAVTNDANPWNCLFWPPELGKYPEPATAVKSLGIKIDSKLTLAP